MQDITPGSLYLIPVPIAEGALATLSPEVSECTARIRHYFAEQARTARRFLRAMHPKLPLEQVHFSEIDKHSVPDIALLRQWLHAGLDVGVMSEAGCPGIADPGAEVVRAAHKFGARVVPLTGPSSLLLALMASGLNGQSFCFHGYLPVKEPQRSKRIRDLEQQSAKESQTQIFIETPYRNNLLFNDLLRTCPPATLLCVAQDITAPAAFICTRTVADWKRVAAPELGKSPAVFLMLAGGIGV